MHDDLQRRRQCHAIAKWRLGWGRYQDFPRAAARRSASPEPSQARTHWEWWPASSTPALKAFTTSPALCSTNGGAPSSACALPFVDSGLLLTVLVQTSGEAGSFSVAAVKKSDDTKALYSCLCKRDAQRQVLFGLFKSGDRKHDTRQNGSAIGTSAATATSLALCFQCHGKQPSISL